MSRSYRFVKGEDVTVIGNPGLGDEVVLENAISRGVMSSRTVIDGQDYLQMSIAINPGNSGGPVFDPAGRVIGVATLKSSKAESMGFCIPVEDVNAALVRLDLQTDAVRTATLSRHRARAAFKMLTSAGALYAIALDIRAGVLARLPALGEGTDLLPTEPAQALDEVLTHLEQRQLCRVDQYVAELGADATLAESARRDYLELASNYKAMKDLYTHPARPAGRYASRAAQLKGEHLRLIVALQKELGFSVPREQLAALQAGPQADPAPDALAEIVPRHARPRLRPFNLVPPPPQPGRMGPPFGGAPGGSDPAQEARERARAMQRKLQEQMEEHMRALRERLDP